MSGEAARFSGRPGDRDVLSARGPQPSNHETDKYIAFLGRSLNALGNRLAVDDPEIFKLALPLLPALKAALHQGVEGMRQSGYSDARIGAVLGMRKQSVQERWPRVAGELA